MPRAFAIPEGGATTGAESKKKDMTYGHVFLFGGDKRDRTADLLNAIQALSQLSYTPRCGKERLFSFVEGCCYTLVPRSQLSYTPKYLTRLAVLPQRKIYITRHCGICQQKIKNFSA